MSETLLKDKKFIELSEYLERKKNESFNIFKVLRLQDYEVRHSNFLAWLFDPNGSHELGTSFLEQCLKSSLGNSTINFNKEIKVETEYCTDKDRRIDILLHSDDFVCVIENKYGSEEHNGQCRHYKEFIEKENLFNHIEKDKKYFIFLDIHVPEETQFNPGKSLEGYKYLTYDKIYDILENLPIKENIQAQIIKQYAAVLKEKYESFDDRAFNLCREICISHKDKIQSLKDYDTSSAVGTQIESIDTLKNFLNDHLRTFFGKIIEDVLSDLGLTLLYKYKSEIFRCIPQKADIKKMKFSTYHDVKERIIFLALNNNEDSFSINFWVSLCEKDNRQKREDICEIIKKKQLNDSKNKDNGKWWLVRNEEIISKDNYFEIALKSRNEIRAHIREMIEQSGIIDKFTEVVKEFEQKNNIMKIQA